MSPFTVTPLMMMDLKVSLNSFQKVERRNQAKSDKMTYTHVKSNAPSPLVSLTRHYHSNSNLSAAIINYEKKLHSYCS